VLEQGTGPVTELIAKVLVLALLQQLSWQVVLPKQT